MSHPTLSRPFSTRLSQVQSPPLSSPTSPIHSSRSPDATPVPSNPNPRLASAIPSLAHASRRISSTPSSSPNAPRAGSKVGATPLRTQSVIGGSKRTSVASSLRSLRANSLHTSISKSNGIATPSSGGGSALASTSVALETASGPATVQEVAQEVETPGERDENPGIVPSNPITLAPVLSSTEAEPVAVPQGEIPQAAAPIDPPQSDAVRVAAPTESPQAQPPATPAKGPVNGAIANAAMSPNVKRGSPANARLNAGKPPTPKVAKPLVTRTPFSPQSQKTVPTTPARNGTPKVTVSLSPAVHAQRQASPAPPGVPWNSSGGLNGTAHELDTSIYGGSGPSRDQSLSGSMWHPETSHGDHSRSMGPGIYGDEDGEMSLELYTEVDANDLDEDIQVAFDDVRMIFMRKLTHYKRLLEQAQTSSASQLHALQAELRLLRLQIDAERKNLRDVEVRAGRDREALLLERRNRHNGNNGPAVGGGSFDILSTFQGDGRGTFDEAEVRRVVRGLRMSDRMRLIHLILDSCLPGDISQMIRLLEKYAASTFDLVSSLPQDIAARILSYLSVNELLEAELVSKAWQAIVHHPAIWRQLCLNLTWSDPVPLRWPADAAEWEPLYKSLHHRERNFATGCAQSLRFLRGHTNFCTTLILKGNRLISGSYDETIRFWDIRTGKETHCLKAKAISCLDFLPEEEVLVAGFHDVGRVQVYSTVTWAPLQTLQGHLYGIRSVAITSHYVVSAGADKAIVCWDWRSGQKIVRFGQQTNLNIGVQIIDDETVVGVTVDGVVRTFSIRRKEMISQFKLSELVIGDPTLSSRISHVGVGANNMLQWFAAKGKQITCATKSLILHLEWNDYDSPPTPSATSPATFLSPLHAHTSASLSRSTTTSPVTSRRSLGGNMPRKSLPAFITTSPARKPFTPNLTTNMTIPPRILAVIDTPDVAVGAVDPLKRRVATATRFSSRAGADRRIFLSTYSERGRSEHISSDEDSLTSQDDASIATPPITLIGGAWNSCATGPPEDAEGIFNLPPDFKGLATPAFNPMSMALSHEEVVVGCADGTIYVMSFVGYKYSKYYSGNGTPSGDGMSEYH